MAAVWNGRNLKSSQARRSVASEFAAQGALQHHPRNCAVAVREDQVRMFTHTGAAAVAGVVTGL